MSGGYQTTATRKSLPEAILALIDKEQRSKLNNIPAKVVGYDVATQRMVVQPLISQNFGKKTLRSPELQDVPHMLQRGGGLLSYLPLKLGDKVILQASSRSLDNYLTGDKDLSASTGRHSDMSDMIAMSGFHSDSEALKNLKDDRMHHGTEDGNSGFQMNKEGKGDVKLKGETSILKLISETNALLNEVNSSTKSLANLLGGLSSNALSASSITQIVQLVTTFGDLSSKITGLNSKIEGVRLE